MKPYYQDDYVTIYHGRSSQVRGRNSVSIELNEEYIPLQVQRLRQEVLPL